jgi:soluble lytic murein transglycosylase-like protein
MSFYPADAQRGIGSPYDPIILQAAATYVVDPALIKAIITKESSWNPSAIRQEPQIGDASRGLMQILYTTARGVGYTGAAEGLFDPATNINFGTKYLAAQLSRFGYPQGVSAYNAGRPISGNAQYVADVDAAYAWFIANDPLWAPGGGGPTYFPRATAIEWRERVRRLAERQRGADSG